MDALAMVAGGAARTFAAADFGAGKGLEVVWFDTAEALHSRLLELPAFEQSYFLSLTFLAGVAAFELGLAVFAGFAATAGAFAAFLHAALLALPGLLQS